MSKRKMTWQMILLICIVGLLVTNVLVVTKLVLGLERLKSCQHRRESLPCQGVPTKFVIEEPECADKLLRSMNVTNVRILSADALDSLLNKTTLRFQNVS
ncbi:MAG: hypothetical protein ACYTFW_02960 [Planctomycetota bacterium]|jgi:hypothetical protein